MGKKQTPNEWHHHIKKQRQGKQTRVEYCRNHDLTISSFDYWAGRIRKQNDSKDKTIVRVGVVETPNTMGNIESPPVILHINDQYRLMISSPVNQEELKKIIEVLEKR